MKERPIIFSSPMIRAILDGRKTVTRRVVKHPEYYGCPTGDCPHSTQYECNQAMNDPVVLVDCPYGQPGDRLWVRETAIYWTYPDGRIGGLTPVVYADSPDWAGVQNDMKLGRPQAHPASVDRGWWKKRSAIHMPRQFSRITLEVVSVRAERLQDITEEDAKAEGAVQSHGEIASGSFRDGFADLWDAINGSGSWAKDPWVWRVEFKRVQP